jgi:hypothetical protein
MELIVESRCRFPFHFMQAAHKSVIVSLLNGYRINAVKSLSKQRFLSEYLTVSFLPLFAKFSAPRLFNEFKHVFAS